ncbi:MAG TPA: HAMP domain-containing sensor histidine kinase [Thermomicrobiales bacterium]|nr:HAMP domain-containing sensor histidine kinase [Thermomicrobiales bacterium]
MNTAAGQAKRWTTRLLDWLVWRPLAWCSKVLYRHIRWLLTPSTWWRLFSWIRFSSISLRRWLFIALLLLAFVPAFLAGVVAAGVVLTEHRAITETEEMVQNGANWTDPAWQSQLSAQAARDQAEVVLYQNGDPIFRTTGVELPFTDLEGVLTTIQPEDPTASDQTAAIRYLEPPNHDQFVPLVPVSYFIFLALTFGGLALFFGRSVVKPLAATSVAAGDVAGGNLEITLPRSRVREVRELNAAFEGMAVELKESLEHEAKLEEERKQFISAIVHDLRTPLFALRGSFEAIETGVADTPDKQKYYFQLARERADALDRMITDLFEFTRLEYLDQQPVRAPLDLGELMARVAETVQPRATAQDSTLLLDVRPGLCEISADAHLLTRAFDNLLDNALRYSGPGSTIWIECLAAPGSVVFSISDDGPGIPAEDLPYLFNPLFRGESSRNRKTGGAGLGLTIARNIVTAHGGTLTARNRTPHGAMFIGSLPCASPGA